ncbi:hypothetical protein ACF08M_30205 [Streptomyces sp. NPDC015032]|uniref:hypothetical protein n=1 Tax=Streptomyces sp. NPDC015032 TaxID=3364937 RepID=UPI0036F5FC95
MTEVEKQAETTEQRRVRMVLIKWSIQLVLMLIVVAVLWWQAETTGRPLWDAVWNWGGGWGMPKAPVKGWM